MTIHVHDGKIKKSYQGVSFLNFKSTPSTIAVVWLDDSYEVLDVSDDYGGYLEEYLEDQDIPHVVVGKFVAQANHDYIRSKKEELEEYCDHQQSQIDQLKMELAAYKDAWSRVTKIVDNTPLTGLEIEAKVVDIDADLALRVAKL